MLHQLFPNRPLPAVSVSKWLEPAQNVTQCRAGRHRPASYAKGVPRRIPAVA